MALAISNYDSKSESEILDELQNNDFTVSELENIYVYEKNNQNRQSILEEIDTQLTVTVDVPQRGYFGQWFDSGGRYTVRRNVKIQREIDSGDLQLVHYGSGAPSDEPEVLKSPIGHASTHEPNGPDALFDQELSTGASPSFQSVDTERLFNTSEETRIIYVDDNTGEYVAQSATNEITRTTDSGTDAIQAAINDLPSDGGTVHLRKGRYDIADPTFSKTHIEIPETKSNVNLVGEGFGSEIYLPDNTTETDAGKLIINVFGSGCTFSNFAINGNQDNQGNIGDAEDGHNIKVLGDDFTMHSVKSYNSPGDGIELETDEAPTTENITITNCIFSNNQEQDLHCHGVQNVTFTGNICTGVHDDGSVSFFTDVVDNENITVADNILSVDPTDGLQGIAFDAADTSLTSRNIKIHDNLILNATRGIDIDGQYCEDVEIVNNTILGTRMDAAIWVNGGTDIQIRDNTVKNSNIQGIRLFDGVAPLKNVWVENNTIQNNNRGDNNEDSLAVDASGNSIDNVFIRNNDIFTDSAPHHRRPMRFQENTASTYGVIHCTGNWVKNADYQNVLQQYPVTRFGNENMNDALDIEPTTKWVGLEVTTDGANWDPDGDGTAEDVRWSGSAWVEVVDYGTTLNANQ